MAKPTVLSISITLIFRMTGMPSIDLVLFSVYVLAFILQFQHEVPYDEDEKRGMDVPFQKSSAPCTEWVDRFFKEYLVMHEDRAAEFSDLQRFFMFMDDDGKSCGSLQR